MAKVFTTAELKGKTYGTFHRNGVSVDLARYFKSEAGKQALSDISARPDDFARSKPSKKAK